MKGRTPSAAQRRYHSLLAALGCIACRKEGRFNDQVSIHHVDGRTKPSAHWQVLPLCGPHHQDDGTAIAVHPWKRRFELAYGTQEALIRECVLTLLDAGHELPDELLALIGLKEAA